MSLPLQIVIHLRDLNVGGAEKSLVLLANGLSQRGHAVSLIAWNTQGALKNILLPSVNLIELKTASWIVATFKLASNIRKHQPDAVISALLKANFASALAGLFSQKRASIFVTEHSNLQMYLKDKALPQRFICWVVLMLTHRMAGKVISVTEANCRIVEQATHLKAGTVGAIGNPIYTPENASPATHPWLEDKNIPLLLAVGRLETVKNFGFLLDVMQQLIHQLHCRLIILGEGSEKNALQQRIADLGLKDYVRIVHNHTDLSAFYSRADTLLISSHHESFSMVMLEAFYYGTPVVAIDCPTGPRVVSNNGMLAHLVNAGDVKSFTEAVKSTLKQGKSEELQLRLKAQALQYNVETIAHAYEQYINTAR